MDSQRFQRIAAIFEDVRALPPEQRHAALDQACAGDLVLRGEVARLLAHHDAATHPIDTPLLAAPITPADVRAGATPLPKQVGRYEIVRLLGEGGMGAVYEARQDNPRRTVALKVIHSRFASPAVLRRFEHEAQILGRLQHPGIAQIFEAGTFDAGHGAQPFFAMEMITGVPLTQFARAGNLGTRDRLTLIARIGDAVQHAHQKGVIHRDLKPDNILVDENGQPKILDFGVARVTDADVQMTTLRTGMGQLVGTIPYMSPEQAAGDPEELDTRSDVYALGVLAYELLAGKLPYDLHRKLIHEAVRVIQQEEPTRLSAVSRTFRGDIENIVGKALEKDRTRSYQAASDLSEDIRRYLRDEAVIARPPSRAYQLGKFAKRHKALVAGVVAVIVVLTAGIVATTLAMLRARDAEAVAVDRKTIAESETAKAAAAEHLAEMRLEQVQKEKAKADAVVSFQQEMLASVDPRTAGSNRDITVREVLDEAARKLDGGSLTDQPEVEGAVRYALGATYFALGHYAESVRHLRRSLELRRQAFGDEHLETSETMAMLGETYREMADLNAAEPLSRGALAIREKLSPGTREHADSLNNVALIEKSRRNLDQCEQLNQRALEIRRKLFGNIHPDVMKSLNNLAMLKWGSRGDTKGAIALLEECLDVGRQLYAGDHPWVANSMQNLAQVYESAGEVDRGIALMRDALQMRRSVLGEDHELVGEGLNNLAAMLKRKGALTEAEPLYRRALEVRIKALGPEDPRVSETMNNLGTLLHAMGGLDESIQLARQALELRQKVNPGDHPLVALYMANLANVLTTADKLDEAEQITNQSIEMRRRMGEQRSTNYAAGLLNYASLKRERGDLAAAEALQREALGVYRSQNTQSPPQIAGALNNLGTTLRDTGRFDEAQAMLDESLEIRMRVLGPNSTFTSASLQNVAVLRLEQGRLDEAEAMMRQSMDIRRAQMPAGHLDIASGLTVLGRILTVRGRFDDAEPMLREGLDIRRSNPAAGLPRIADSAGELGACLLAQKKSAEAEPLLEESAEIVLASKASLPSTRRKAMQRMIDLCEATGRTDDASDWKARLAQLPPASQPSTAPATTQP